MILILCVLKSAALHLILSASVDCVVQRNFILQVKISLISWTEKQFTTVTISLLFLLRQLIHCKYWNLSKNVVLE